MTRDPMLPEALRISRVVRETADTFTLTLNAAERGGFFFLPGQFNMLYLHGAGEVPVSISGDPARPMYLVHTIRAVGSVTRPMQALEKGDEIGVRGPFGTSWPLERARGRDVLVVAGGIGLAPLRPVVYHVLKHRKRFDHLVILYGARTPADLLYEKELARWRGRLDVELDVTVDRAEADYRGRSGVVTKLLSRVSFDPENAIAFLCGPEVMMRFAARELEQRGMRDSDIWVSAERNMKCGLGTCGHCQLGPVFVCKDGPVFRHSRIAPLLTRREL